MGNSIKGSDIPVRIPYSLRADAVSSPNMRSFSGMAMASMLCRKFWITRPAERGIAMIKSSGNRADIENAFFITGNLSREAGAFASFWKQNHKYRRASTAEKISPATIPVTAMEISGVPFLCSARNALHRNSTVPTRTNCSRSWLKAGKAADFLP